MHWEIATPNEALVRQLMRETGICRPIAMVLVNRGIPSEDLEGFLNPKLRDLVDPFLIPGMEQAAARIWQAIHNQERILVHGDYDADGITSTVLLAWVLRENGAEVDCFPPHRMEDGYGLTPDSVDKALTPQHKLLITVDCGITSNDATAVVAERGIDVIITDHHQPGPELPKAVAVINPKLFPELTPLRGLAGVGVCFKLCHAFIKYGRQTGLGGMHLDLREGMDLVALGTVADIVPLLGENRSLVRHGIKVLSAQRRPGIRALCETVRLNDGVTPEDVTYRLAPRLNAAGRLGDPEIALRLLQSRSIVDAYPLAAALDECNRERQSHEEKAFRSAMKQIAPIKLNERYTIVVKGRNWHRGVIGIVASRLTQEFSRPTIVLTIDDNNEVHGSGRSVDGINLVDTLHLCSDYLIRYGGHPMATGLALTEDRILNFEEAFENAVRETCTSTRQFTPTQAVDGDALLSELDDTFFEQLQQLMPFGHSNSAPVYRFRRLRPERIGPAGKDHARGTLSDSDGNTISFIAFGRRPADFPPAPWHVVATPELHRFRGVSSPQLQVADVVSAD